MKAGLFSIQKWRMRFMYALHGVLVFCRTEHNAVIYSLSTLAVIMASIMKGVIINEVVEPSECAGHLYRSLFEV